MKIYQVEAEDHLFVVIAKSEEEAEKIVKEYYYDEFVPAIEVTDERELTEGIVLSYDYEDIYWQK